MDLLNVEINNFLIIGQASVNLSNRGLCRIAGENLDDTTSSSNGAGKSSIFEAVYWALFGETLRNIRSSDGVVNNTTKKDCSVSVYLQEEGTEYQIARYRNHTKYKNGLYLYINGVDSRGKDNKDTQAYVESIVGMDKQAFANSVVFGQGNSKNLRRFSEMTDSEKKATLEKILNLDAFVRAHGITKDQIRDVEAELQRLDVRGQDLSVRVIVCEETLSEFLQKAKAFDEDKEQKLRLAVEQKKVAEDAVLDFRTRIAGMVIEDISELQEVVTGCDEMVVDARDRDRKLHGAYTDRKGDRSSILRSIESDISRDKKKLAGFLGKEHVGEVCGKCGNMITGEALHAAKDGCGFDIIDRERSVDALSKEISSLSTSYETRKNQIEEEVKDIEAVILEVKGKIQAAGKVSDEKRELEHLLTVQEGRVESHQTLVDHISSTENSWEASSEKYAADLEGLVAQWAELETESSLVEGQLSQLRFWETAFSRTGIRSYLLDSVVPFLNERVNHYLSILTDGGISAKFSTVKQISSGEYRDNFNLEIINRNAADTYEGNSGGEKRRIDLGVALGFNDFLASRSGKKFNLLLLDEVFEGVDADGLYYVIKVLEDIARRKSSVFVITHRDELKGYFPDEILIGRKDGLSYIQEAPAG